MAEHGERVKAATNATTLGQLQALVADLQTANAPVHLPDLNKPRPKGWAMKAAVAGALVLLGVGIGWGVYGRTSSPLSFIPADQGAQPDGVAPVVLTPPHQLHSMGGVTGLMQQMREKFGDTMGYEMDVYPTTRYSPGRTRPNHAAHCATTTAAAGTTRRPPQ
jgi:hypothetical protein